MSAKRRLTFTSNNFTNSEVIRKVHIQALYDESLFLDDVEFLWNVNGEECKKKIVLQECLLLYWCTGVLSASILNSALPLFLDPGLHLLQC